MIEKSDSRLFLQFSKKGDKNRVYKNIIYYLRLYLGPKRGHFTSNQWVIWMSFELRYFVGLFGGLKGSLRTILDEIVAFLG